MTKKHGSALGPGADGDIESTVVTPEAPAEPASSDASKPSDDDSKE